MIDVAMLSRAFGKLLLRPGVCASIHACFMTSTCYEVKMPIKPRAM